MDLVGSGRLLMRSWSVLFLNPQLRITRQFCRWQSGAAKPAADVQSKNRLFFLQKWGNWRIGTHRSLIFLILQLLLVVHVFFQLDRPFSIPFSTPFAAIIDHHSPRGPISPSDVAAFSLAHAPQDFQHDRRDGAEVWSTDLERSQRLKQIPPGFQGGFVKDSAKKMHSLRMFEANLTESSESLLYLLWSVLQNFLRISFLCSP